MHLRLPVVWTALRRRGLGVFELVRWCCTAPADLAGLPRKGRIVTARITDVYTAALAIRKMWVRGAPPCCAWA